MTTTPLKAALLPTALALLISVPAFAGDNACGEYTSVDIGDSTVDMGNKTRFVHFRSSTQMNAGDG